MGTDFLLLLERDVDTSGLEPGHNKFYMFVLSNP